MVMLLCAMKFMFLAMGVEKGEKRLEMNVKIL
jgi:hypothetical protein